MFWHGLRYLCRARSFESGPRHTCRWRRSAFLKGTTDEGHGVLFGDGCSVASIVLKNREKKPISVPAQMAAVTRRYTFPTEGNVALSIKKACAQN